MLWIHDKPADSTVKSLRGSIGIAKVSFAVLSSCGLVMSVPIGATGVSAEAPSVCFDALGVTWDVDPWDQGGGEAWDPSDGSFSSEVTNDSVELIFTGNLSQDEAARFYVTFRSPPVDACDAGADGDNVGSTPAPTDLQFCWEWSGLFESTLLVVVDSENNVGPLPGFVQGVAEPVRVPVPGVEFAATPGMMSFQLVDFTPSGEQEPEEVTLSVVFSTDGRCPGDEGDEDQEERSPWFDFSFDRYVIANSLPDTL